jgi:creatinine amidohydrolase
MKYQIEKGINFAQIDVWRFAAEHGDDIFEMKGRMAHGHASECGTSVMLYLQPHLVNMEKATRVEPPADTADYTDIVRYVPMALKSPDATVGDATLGTKEKGEKVINKCVDIIVTFMNEKWTI